MTIVFPSVPASTTLYVPFHTFNSSGASVTISGLAVTDIEIYKNGSTTQRSSDNGYTLLDTDGIDFDGITGIHGFSVDLSDNTDAGFYAVGSTYWIVISSITVNAQTVNFVAAVFRIVAAENTSGTPVADAVRVSGTAQTAGDLAALASAIKTKTDSLTFTVANQVDANVLSLASTLRAGIRKNTALSAFEFPMVDTSGVLATGKTVSVTRSVDGGAFGAGTLSSVTEVGSGVYAVDFATGDLNGNVITLKGSATGCKDTVITIKTSP